MLDVLIYGDPVLRKKALAVDVFDEKLQEFVDQLTETMYEEDGLGLAATQVGRTIRVAVIDVSGGEHSPLVLVNPVITWSSEELGDYEEGCLSVPDINCNVKRPVSVSVTACDVSGKEYALEKTDGLLARALQHEIDHLDGILFVDRISPLQRQLLAGKLRRMARTGRADSKDR